MKLSFKASHHKEGATNFLQVEEPFHFASGGSIPAVTLAYETWGELDEARSNAVLILTGLSPNAHAASSADDPTDGWWEPMIGPGKAIDTDRHFVICVNSLGSCFGSTGPASIDPRTGEPYRMEFPVLTVEDNGAGIPAAETVLADSSLVLWTAVRDRDGKVWVGSGHEGLVWRVNRRGAASLVSATSA